MAGAMYPVVTMKSEGLPGNDSKHNKADLNRGGGPAFRNRKKVQPAVRGGFGHQGQRVHQRASMPSGRSGSGNPGKSPSVPHVGRRAFPSEQRNPGHGGSVQVRDNMDTVAGRGGFGHSGQQGVPGVRTNPKPSAGNTGGRMARRVAGHFTNKTKGAGGNTGSYGGPPVRLDTR